MSDLELEPNPLADAQKRLAAASHAQPVQLPQAAGYAYVCALVHDAYLQAIIEFLTAPTNLTWSAKEALEAAIARHLNKKAEEIEAATNRILLAQAPPHVRVS